MESSQGVQVDLSCMALVVRSFERASDLLVTEFLWLLFCYVTGSIRSVCVRLGALRLVLVVVVVAARRRMVWAALATSMTGCATNA